MRRIQTSLILLLLISFFQSLNAGINIQAYYSLADKLKTTGKLSGANSDFESATSGTPGLLIEYEQNLSNPWGFAIGAGGELGGGGFRTITNTKVTQGGSVVSQTNTVNPQPYIFSFLVYGNLIYRLGEATYVFGGLNYSLPVYFKGSNSNADISLTSALGFQFGGGYRLSNNWAFEGAYQILNAGGQDKTNNITFDSANLSGIRLGLKYSL